MTANLITLALVSVWFVAMGWLLPQALKQHALAQSRLKPAPPAPPAAPAVPIYLRGRVHSRNYAWHVRMAHAR